MIVGNRRHHPNTCRRGSWLQHGRNFGSESRRTYCCVMRCMKRPEVSAHVQKDNTTEGGWYMILVCAEHNARIRNLDIANYAVLVSAKVAETCGGLERGDGREGRGDMPWTRDAGTGSTSLCPGARSPRSPLRTLYSIINSSVALSVG
jgi:hypothetical protein